MDLWAYFFIDTQMLEVPFVTLSQWRVYSAQLDVTLGNDLFQPLAFRCIERGLGWKIWMGALRPILQEWPLDSFCGCDRSPWTRDTVECNVRTASRPEHCALLLYWFPDVPISGTVQFGYKTPTKPICHNRIINPSYFPSPCIFLSQLCVGSLSLMCFRWRYTHCKPPSRMISQILYSMKYIKPSCRCNISDFIFLVYIPLEVIFSEFWKLGKNLGS